MHVISTPPFAAIADEPHCANGAVDRWLQYWPHLPGQTGLQELLTASVRPSSPTRAPAACRSPPGEVARCPLSRLGTIPRHRHSEAYHPCSLGPNRCTARLPYAPRSSEPHDPRAVLGALRRYAVPLGYPPSALRFPVWMGE